jgi:hypothetical protein
MTAVTTNQKEVVRLLSLEHGHKRASELSGVPYDVVRQWSVRGNWKASHSVTKATVDRVASELASHEHGTRLTLAKYAHNASRAIHRSVHPAKWTKEAKDLASVMATVHRQDEGKGQSFSLNVLNINSLSLDSEPEA